MIYKSDSSGLGVDGMSLTKPFWIWEGNVQSSSSRCAWLLLISLLNHGFVIQPHCNSLVYKVVYKTTCLTAEHHQQVWPRVWVRSVRGAEEEEAEAACPQPGRYSHAHEERLLGRQPRGRVLLHQRQRAEAKLVNGLVGVQGGKVRVHLAVVLGDVQAVGADVVAATESAWSAPPRGCPQTCTLHGAGL